MLSPVDAFFRFLPLSIALCIVTDAEALAQQLQPGRTMRYTSGSTTTSNWERSLVKGTPNLGHFYWSPITSYSQNYVKVPLPANDKLANAQAPAPRQPGSIYVKPTHVPLPMAQREPRRTVARVSAKLASVAPPGTACNLSAQLRSERLSGKLLQQPSARPMVATYCSGYPTYNQDDLRGALARKDVRGQILNR
jgi:hypothetical protein